MKDLLLLLIFREFKNTSKERHNRKYIREFKIPQNSWLNNRKKDFSNKKKEMQDKKQDYRNKKKEMQDRKKYFSSCKKQMPKLLVY